MLWLALHLPLLPLEAFSATLSVSDAARPVALLAEHRVAQVNTAAAERGLRPGIKRATALTLAADLLLAEAHPGREAAALQAVAHAALAFTPAVCLHGPQTVLLDSPFTSDRGARGDGVDLDGFVAASGQRWRERGGPDRFELTDTGAVVVPAARPARSRLDRVLQPNGSRTSYEIDWPEPTRPQLEA